MPVGLGEPEDAGPAKVRSVIRECVDWGSNAALASAAMKGRQAEVAERFRWQAGWCGKLGSQLYEDLLNQAAADIERGGPVWEVLAGDDPGADGLLPGAQALRLMGAVHRLVLEGRAAGLAAFYPSAGGVVAAGAPRAFVDLLAQQRDEVAALAGNPVQTNEPGRSAGLMGGFLEVARQTGLPLQLLEIGASAGLNLRWDRYFYTAPGASWGDPRSAVRFEPAFSEGAPPFDVEPEVVARRGCDPAPLDAGKRSHQLTLMSYVWPDQVKRFEQLRGALEVAAALPVQIDRAGAVEWLEERFAEPRPGVATVVFHSVVLPYLGEEGIADLKRTIETAGAAATADSPLAWLSMEAGAEQADVRLTTWPGAESRVLARATFHGPPVRFLG